MKPRDIPNIISVVRILLVAPVVVFLLHERFTVALWLFIIAGISDGLDGFLAKQFGWASRLGAILDPIADKLLMLACYLCLGWLGQLPAWLVAAVIARDVVIVAGSLAWYRLIGGLDIQPSIASKVNTFFQLLLVVVVLVAVQPVAVPAWLIDALIVIVLMTTVVSGVGYVVTWSRRAAVALRADKTGE